MQKYCDARNLLFRAKYLLKRRFHTLEKSLAQQVIEEDKNVSQCVQSPHLPRDSGHRVEWAQSNVGHSWSPTCREPPEINPLHPPTIIAAYMCPTPNLIWHRSKGRLSRLYSKIGTLEGGYPTQAMGQQPANVVIPLESPYESVRLAWKGDARLFKVPKF